MGACAATVASAKAKLHIFEHLTHTQLKVHSDRAMSLTGTCGLMSLQNTGTES